MIRVYIQSSELNNEGYVFLKNSDNSTEESSIAAYFRSTESIVVEEPVLHCKNDFIAFKKSGLQEETSRVCYTTLLLKGIETDNITESQKETIKNKCEDFLSSQIDNLKKYVKPSNKAGLGLCYNSELLGELEKSFQYLPLYDYKKNNKSKKNNNSLIIPILAVFFLVVTGVGYFILGGNNGSNPDMNDMVNGQKPEKSVVSNKNEEKQVEKFDFTWGSLNFETITQKIINDMHFQEEKPLAEKNFPNAFKKALDNKAIENKKLQYLFLSDGDDKLEAFYGFSSYNKIIPESIIGIREKHADIGRSLSTLAEECRKMPTCSFGNKSEEYFSVIKRVSEFVLDNRNCFDEILNLNYSEPMAPFFFEKDKKLIEIINRLFSGQHSIVSIPYYKNGKYETNSLKGIVKSLNESKFGSGLEYAEKVIKFASKQKYSDKNYCDSRLQIIKCIKDLANNLEGLNKKNEELRK